MTPIQTILNLILCIPLYCTCMNGKTDGVTRRVLLLHQRFSERMQAFHFSRFEINKPDVFAHCSLHQVSFYQGISIFDLFLSGEWWPHSPCIFLFHSLSVCGVVFCVCMCVSVLRVLKGGFQAHFPAHIFSKSYFPVLKSHSGHG